MKYCPECRQDLDREKVASTERFVCTSSSCGFVHWNNPTPVVAGLVRCKDKFVLGRNSAWRSGLFSMFTGFLEAEETPEQGIIREVKEEIGLKTVHAEFIGHFPLARRNQLIIAYSLEARGEVTLSSEIAEVKFLTAEELKNFDFGPLTLTRDVVSQWYGWPAT